MKLIIKSIFILLISYFSSQFIFAHEFLAEGFAVQKVTDEFDQVTNIEFDHLGRMFVGRRRGYVDLYEEGKEAIQIIVISIWQER